MSSNHRRQAVRVLTASLLSVGMIGAATMPAIAQSAPSTRPSVDELNRRAIQATRRLSRTTNSRTRDISKASEAIRKVFLQAVTAASESTVELKVGGSVKALGTVVEPQYVLTKASELGDFAHVTVTSKTGQAIPAKVLGVVDDHDLALVQVDLPDMVPVKLQALSNITPGLWVGTPMPTGQGLAGYGIVSVGRRSTTAGFLGVQLGESDGKGVKVVAVNNDSPASRGGVKPGDLITAINETQVADTQQLRDLLASQSAGQNATVVVLRGSEKLNLDVVLAKRPAEESPRALMQNTMGGELSARRTNFKAVYQHDTVLAPSQIGGPLVDLKGRIIGVNIARSGRVETLAVPADVIIALLPDMKAGKFPVPTPPAPATRPTTQVSTSQPTTRP